MDEIVLEHVNPGVHQKIEKLYLDEKSADVYFIFGIDTENSERVPAHKNILALGSEYFNMLFYGPWPETGDIHIVDASAGEFKDFLQFFYFSKVRLTPRYLIGIMILCTKYDMCDGTKVCELVLQNVITIDYLCWGYGIAIFLNQKNLLKFCEEQIKENAVAVLKSTTFFECTREFLAKMLPLILNECSAEEIVDGCMEWAKYECKRNHLVINSKNLRFQFDGLFEQIPFDKLTIEYFSQYISKYPKFFHVKELEHIIQDVALNKSQMIECKNERTAIFDRQSTSNESDHFESVKKFGLKSMSQFISSERIILTDFSMTLKRSSTCKGIKGEYILFKKDEGFLQSKKVQFNILHGVDEFCVTLPEPVQIDPYENYVIQMNIENCCGSCFIHKAEKDTIEFCDDIEIRCRNELEKCGYGDFISKLHFEIPAEVFYGGKRGRDGNNSSFSSGKFVMIF